MLYDGEEIAKIVQTDKAALAGSKNSSSASASSAPPAKKGRKAEKGASKNRQAVLSPGSGLVDWVDGKYLLRFLLFLTLRTDTAEGTDRTDAVGAGSQPKSVPGSPLGPRRESQAQSRIQDAIVAITKELDARFSNYF